jgi:gamma-polyglutamate synthase
MNTPFLFSLSLWAGLLGYLRWESRVHGRSLAKIPLRIHVNGTRGKSSVTRLISAGLSSGGLNVFAKTTGTLPRLIKPDGSEEPIKRRGPANIRENMGFLRTAADAGADAIVVECMALRPDLQWALEHRMLKSHIGVITNIRPDHEDVMGKGLIAVAKALAQTIPSRGTLVTTQESAAILRETGAFGAELLLRPAPEKLPQELLAAFPYEVFEENIALALTVCEICGVDRSNAMRGMTHAAPDVGNVIVHRLFSGNKTVLFINALAANDPQSTMLIWDRYMSQDEGSVIVILNARRDRKYRTMQLCRTLGMIHHGPMIATGDSSFVSRRMRPFDGVEVVTADCRDCFHVLQQAIGQAHGPLVKVFAAGNLLGMEPLLANIVSMAGERKSD